MHDIEIGRVQPEAAFEMVGLPVNIDVLPPFLSGTASMPQYGKLAIRSQSARQQVEIHLRAADQVGSEMVVDEQNLSTLHRASRRAMGGFCGAAFGERMA